MRGTRSSRCLRDDIEEFIGQLFLWGLVAIAGVLLYLWLTRFIHPIIAVPICAVFGILGGFGVVIGLVALLNWLKRIFRQKEQFDER